MRTMRTGGRASRRDGRWGGMVGAVCLSVMAAGCSSADGSGAPVDEPTGADELVGESQEGLTCLTIRRGTLGNIYDATITDDPTNPTSGNQNAGTAIQLFTGVLGPALRQSLMKFDLSPIPTGAVITSASLNLRKQFSPGQGIVNLHTVSGTWSENTVTWNNFGGAFAPTVSASINTALVPDGGTASVDITSLVKSWANGSLPNEGILLEQAGAGRTTFGASDGVIATRPTLSVCYGPVQCGNGVQEGNEVGVDCGGPCGPCQGTLLAVEGAGGVSGSLWSVDVSTGVASVIGATPAMTGLAVSPTGAVYGTSATSYNTGSLLAVDPSTGGAIVIGPTVDANGTDHAAMPDLTFVGNTLYAWTEDSDDLAVIDPLTGFVTVVGDSPHGTYGSGLAADANGVVWQAGDGGYNGSNLYTMDLVSGFAVAKKVFSGPQYDVIRGMTFMNGTLWAIGSDWGNVTDLITINTNNGQIHTVAPLPLGTESLAVMPAAGTCSDGVFNNGETNIDCGGPNCAGCQTCTDGIQNQGETGVDCGGSCLPCGAPILLLTTGAGASPANLYAVDANTAQNIKIGPVGSGITGMATSETGLVYATTSTSWNSPGELVQIDPQTGAGTTIAQTTELNGTNHPAIPDVTFVNGSLLGWSEYYDQLVSIDTSSGLLTVLPAGVNSYGSGIAADASGTIYLAPDSISGGLYIVDTSGGVQYLGNMDGPNYDVVRGMTFMNGILYAVTSDYSNANTLVTIDPATLHVTAIGPVPAGVEAIAVKP